MENLVKHLLNKKGLTTLKVNFSEELFNRKTNPELEAWIDKKWNEKLKTSGSKLWNGSKFRLDSVENETINIGLTCYKDLHATNHNSPYKLEDKFLANPFGTCGVLITSDDEVIVVKRASWVGENAGKLDLPGGHAEPDNCKTGLNNDSVEKELINSQADELIEELNIKKEEILNHKLHAIFGVPPSKRPVAYFVTTTSLTSEQVLKRHSLGGAETDESAKVFTVKVSELKTFVEKVEDMCLNGILAIGTFLFSKDDLDETEFMELVKNKISNSPLYPTYIFCNLNHHFIFSSQVQQQYNAHHFHLVFQLNLQKYFRIYRFHNTRVKKKI